MSACRPCWPHCGLAAAGGRHLVNYVLRTGAAPLPPELAAALRTLFGLQINESLGMTETTGLISPLRRPA
jgi:long-subunit acyl-CoA synthetase (AMP-forming)